MNSLKLLTCAAVAAFALTTSAFAADNLNSPSNPNCSPGVKDCTANYPTSDLSKDNPAKPAANAMNPNCSPGEKGCTANYPTTDVTKTNPQQK
jgi:hypothetical protein